ncbi:carboxypeptidase-like protein [Tenacibaculum lutimaris]|uniref:Carboxypeptidase-like protein n=1 Tax=Tenacibaculum lutimaris TaxID=285258 RepID=A0A420E2Q3_9FLAO|nr:carboxypeptidase-like regulatory domain-containing protein [Tenacibaculum lutimaris]RKF04424.1 carboxypeptidase-like protein [Tenacibaculum lutimaris]
MKNILVILTYLLSISVTAQKTIEGKVIDYNKNPLYGASVFLNNTTIGTVTNEKGEFELKASSDDYTLVIYFMGFKTFRKLIKVKDRHYLVIELEEQNELLDEVELVTNDSKQPNEFKDFDRLKESLIGNTNLAKRCKILNPEVLQYHLNSKTNELTVVSKKPIEIYNEGLGYKIYYDLVKLTTDSINTSFYGHTRYEELKGTKKQMKRWKRSRLRAYQGSMLHFFRSLYNNNFQEEGFIVNQFEKKKIILKNGEKTEYIPVSEYLNQNDLVFKKHEKTFLNFNHLLEVIYTEEKEEWNYRGSKKQLNHQKSILHLVEKPIEILPSGKLSNPLGIFTERYWAYEKMANSLPSDYQPTKK